MTHAEHAFLISVTQRFRNIIGDHRVNCFSYPGQRLMVEIKAPRGEVLYNGPVEDADITVGCFRLAMSDDERKKLEIIRVLHS